MYVILVIMFVSKFDQKYMKQHFIKQMFELNVIISL